MTTDAGVTDHGFELTGETDSKALLAGRFVLHLEGLAHTAWHQTEHKLISVEKKSRVLPVPIRLPEMGPEDVSVPCHPASSLYCLSVDPQGPCSILPSLHMDKSMILLFLASSRKRHGRYFSLR